MSKNIVIAGACRTAIGKMGGALTHTPVSQLGAIVIKEALRRAGVEPKMVDDVFMGCVLQAGQGQNVARQASIAAGCPIEVPALTVNNLCGSGLKCVNMAAEIIQSGDADIIVAGGMENMSAAPYIVDNARWGLRMGDVPFVDDMLRDGLHDVFNHYHMGVTAENIAKQWHITREMQDEFSALSQQKCEAAMKGGKFNDEIVPVSVKVKKEIVPFVTDEGPRAGVTVESLAKLKPAFLSDGTGTVTAGNASGINDGAAAVVVMSEDKARELGVKPMVRWICGASAGVDPKIMGIGPVYATRKLLAKTGLTVNDFDLIEANEAFAAQSVAVGMELGWNKGPLAERLNVNGGAIALGHPVGASGCRILVTLIHEMLRRGVHRGLATLCVGGGMGVAEIVERYE